MNCVVLYRFLEIFRVCRARSERIEPTNPPKVLWPKALGIEAKAIGDDTRKNKAISRI